MIIKCNCNHCSTHLEFEAGNEGEVIPCPSCGMDTTLYQPQAAVQFPPLAKVLPIDKPKPKSDRATQYLNEVRQDTCYATLRALIDVVFGLYVALAGLFVLGVVMASAMAPARDATNGLFGAAAIFITCVLAVASVVIAVAVKQASLLLVDIADCQVHLYKKAR